MKELFSLSLEKMKKQKRDTILLFMVLSISFAFSLVSLSIMKSMDKTNEEYRYSVYGEWDAAFLDGQEKDADFLKSDPEVEAVGTARKYGHLRTGAGVGVIDEQLWKIMNDLELNKNISNSYVTGIGEAYSHALIFTSMNAGYLSTDYVLADYAAEKGLSFMNSREENDAQIQVQIQTLLLLVSCSLCILLVCLLLLSDILLLEVRQRQKQYIILRAIGMSRKQMHRQMACRALLSGGMAILTGWLGYFGYFLINVLQKKEGYGELIGRNLTYGQALEQFYHNLQSIGFGWELVIIVTTVGMGSIVGIYYLVNRKMNKENINIY